MGTRSLTAVKMDGKYRIAQYGQWDGYPRAQGKTALEFLQTADLGKFKKQLGKTTFIKENDLVEKKINKIFDRVSKASQDLKYPPEAGALTAAKRTLDEEDLFLYYCSTRDTGAKVLEFVYNAPATIKEIPLFNKIEFANDSLFCEWAYVIDFDKNTFEVYKGFNKTPLTKKDRFYDVTKNYARRNNEYFGIKLLKSYKLDKLPNLETFFKLEPKN